MSKELSANIGDMTYDGLVTGTNPACLVQGGTIAALSEAATLVRGTLLAKNSSGKLEVMASGGTADCILCDDTDVGTADTNAAVYVAGCFNPDKLTVADGYTITTADKDTLRTKGIYLVAAAE